MGAREKCDIVSNQMKFLFVFVQFLETKCFYLFVYLFIFAEDLSPAFFPTASDMWTTHPALAYSAAAAAAAAAAAELQGHQGSAHQGAAAAAALQHAHAHHAAAMASVHPALHPQLPVRFFHQLHALQHSQQQQQQQQQLP